MLRSVPKAMSALILAMGLALLAACAPEDLNAPPVPFGDFRLGYNIVVAKQMQPVGPSRPATPAEWEAAVKQAVDARFGKYQGEKLYHIGIGVDAYALAYPGIPLVVKPKSVLVFTVNVWDDTAQMRINAEPKQFTVFEPFSEKTLLGSGLTQTREEQMANLSAKAAKEIQGWLVENKHWFTPEAVAARKLAPRKPGQTSPTPAAPTAAPTAAPASAPAPAN